MSRSPAVRMILLLALAMLVLLAPSLVSEKEKSPQASPASREGGEPEHKVPEHSFADVDRWARIFDSADRDEWQMPVRVVEALGIGPGSTVVDLGAGTGYFTIHLARAVAPGGKVLAIDTEPNMVEYIGQRAEHEGVEGVEPILATADDPRIPEASVDRILLVDTYHHIQDRGIYFGKLRKALTTGGQVVVIDYLKKSLPVGPPPENKMSRRRVVREFQQAGYRLAGERTFLPYQYFLIFEPKPTRD